MFILFGFEVSLDTLVHYARTLDVLTPAVTIFITILATSNAAIRFTMNVLQIPKSKP
jgi:hypothetical protein